MVNLIWSNIPDYQAFLETLFETFLIRKKVSEKTRKNYKSDLRHFFSWASHTNESLPLPNTAPHLPSGETEKLTLYIAAIRAEHIAAYIRDSQRARTPLATINRRLSSLRMLYRFAEEEGWIHENPMNCVRNVRGQENGRENPRDLINAFSRYLAEEGASKTTVRTYTADAADFLTWLAAQS
ncbi:site-specific integrase [Patescibacteria group bacterium]|nr:site-specific integrase [Patescibacteria group bacterium]